jgi:hypothetical protein
VCEKEVNGDMQNFVLRNWRARCQWLTPIILATQKAEIRGIMVRSKPQGNNS